MGVSIEIALPGDSPTDALALVVAAPASPVAGEGARIVDERLGGRLERLAARGDMPAEPGRTLVLHLDGELTARRLVLVGVGPRDAVDPQTLRAAGAAAAAELAPGSTSVTWLLDETLPVAIPPQAAALVGGTLLGAYDPGRWKSTRGARGRLERIVVGHFDEPELRRVVQHAALVTERANRARDLVNAPPNELGPVALAEHAERLAAEHEHLSATTLGPAEIDELGMGALAAVARGSLEGPRLIVLNHDPPGVRQEPVLGLVGKAITFDSGGLSIKPAASMERMKGDMGGGAAVLEGIAAIAALGLPVRTLGVVAACENLVDAASFRPTDILRAANGTTIEVANTDAEGRLVLADALWYARRQGATHVLDLATLTGSMRLALGDLYAGLYANDDEWRERVRAASERSGDLVWPMPLHPRYRRLVDSTFADIRNLASTPYGGPAYAASFLAEFAGEGPWAHVDMSGPSFLDSSRGDELRQPGGTGFGVRLIAELAESLGA